MNYYNKITEALSGASRAYHSSIKKLRKYQKLPLEKKDDVSFSGIKNRIKRSKEMVPQNPHRKNFRRSNKKYLKLANERYGRRGIL